MTRVDVIKEFLKETGFKGIQTFNTKNVVGDSLDRIYNEDDVEIWYCPDYGYLEIFGLTNSEYEQLRGFLYIC